MSSMSTTITRPLCPRVPKYETLGQEMHHANWSGFVLFRQQSLHQHNILPTNTHRQVHFTNRFDCRLIDCHPIGALTPEQGEEFQEIIDENLGDTLNDEQILAALDFILEVLEYIITRGEANYHERSDIDYATEVAKINHKSTKRYQEPTKQCHTYETDSSELEMIESCREEIVKDLYEREKEGINDKENDYEKLLQKVLNVCNVLSGELAKKKEETIGMNPMLGPEDLFMNPNKDVPRKILARVEDEDSIFGSYDKDEMDGFERYYQGRTILEKDEIVEGRDEVNESEDHAEMNYASCDEYDQKMGTVPMEPKEIIGGETPEFLLGIVEKDSCPIPRQNYFLLTQEEEVVYLSVLDAYYDLDEPVEEPLEDAAFGSNVEQEDELEVLLNEVNALIQELVPGEKETAQEPEGEIDIRNNEEEAQGLCYRIDSRDEKVNRKEESKALAYEQELAATKEANGIYRDSIRRKVDTDHVNRIFESDLEAAMEVGTSRNYRRCTEIEFDQFEEKEEKIETVPAEHRKSLDGKTRNESDHKTFEEGSVEERRNSRRPLDGNALDHACDLWIKNVAEFRGMIEKKKDNKLEEAGQYLNAYRQHNNGSDGKGHKKILETGNLPIESEEMDDETIT
ncbi:hypothetical protein C2G38_2163688 [Gigaspora rosea]|uniref:Uncharacterized protein n=1 Tax=Gigaspora rosea TaxID=44941 RepID=A0A397VY82_9GLOM|nr:hypothetical protein C2G38_2163688 [Gigaspora rosea]